MDGLGRAVGDGIGGLFGAAIDGIGGALSGMLDAANQAIPNGLLPVVAIGAVVVLGWFLIKR